MRFLPLALLCATLAAPPAASAATAPAPNIVLIYADNLGYGDLGCYGNRQVQTPRIDRLAREGVRCTSFYVVSTTCTVSRGALLTGRYPQRNGLLHQLATSENWNGVGLPHRERILPQYLKASGYATAAFGKWNIGFAPGSRPTERGFDEFLGCRSGNIHYFKHTYHGEYDIFKGIERHRVEGYSTDIFADAACDFIRRKAGRPFFVYLPFNAPHYVSTVNTTGTDEKPQWHVPGKYLERYGWPADDKTEQHRYLALLTAMDDAVGRVLDTLESTGLRDNTLVMFISDMGAVLRPSHGLGVASNAPFRDGAPSLYEGGSRVPTIFRWPGRIPAGTETNEVLSQLDVLPLCLAAAGGEPPRDRILDGRDPLPVLARREKLSPRELVFFVQSSAALRDGPLKIVRDGPTQPWELYNLNTDPAETKNLAAEWPHEVARLNARYDAWLLELRKDASTPIPQPPPRATRKTG